MKLIFSTLITFALIFNSEYTEIENPEVTESTVYRTSITDAAFETGAPVYMDVNKDGVNDLLFHTVTTHEDGRIITRYMVKGLGKSQVLAADESAAISESGEEISMEPAFANMSWSDRHAEILVHSAETGESAYEGTWSGDRPQYVAFKLAKDGREYMGYAQVTIDAEQGKAKVTEYAINRAAGMPVKI